MKNGAGRPRFFSEDVEVSDAVDQAVGRVELLYGAAHLEGVGHRLPVLGHLGGASGTAALTSSLIILRSCLTVIFIVSMILYD
jgi:hypothetical protein